MPFTGRSIEEIRAKQADELPLKQLKSAHVPHECAKVLKSMLALDPTKRPQSARELLTRIHRCWLRFEPAARQRRKRLVIALTGLALGLALLVLANFVYQRSHFSSELDRSIAVLPFENLSSNADDHFFTIGIQDEILTKLASLADLKVIARTSTQGYQSKPVDLRTVGQQLGVGRVLEGSLQRSADKVRVNVQLIDTRTNAHLWASSYDRKLDDVFAVETDVANAIAQQLDAKLVQRISMERPTANTAAYTAYLRGLGIEHGESAISSFQNAAEAYAEAVQLDPDFALAWARLSLVRGFLYFNEVNRNANSAQAVKQAADQAMALAPQLGEAWLAQGVYRSSVLRDRAGALEAYREAEKRLPNSALVNEYMVRAECSLGHWKDAEAHLSKATRLDPRNFRLWSRAAQDVFRSLGRSAEAEAALDRALESSPNNEYAITAKAELFQEQGRLADAAKQLRLIPNDSTDKYVLLIRATQALLERNFDAAIYWTNEATKSIKPDQSLSDQDTYGLMLQGYSQQWGGRSEEARATFERLIHFTGLTDVKTSLWAHSFLAMAYAGIGEKQKSLEEASQAVADNENDAVIGPITQANRAKVLAQVGELDAAINALSHLLEIPGGIRPSDLRFSPFWDPLRKDARFEALLKNPPPIRY
jgi:TolB-like protein/Tfp pilus assembly protein PilF